MRNLSYLSLIFVFISCGTKKNQEKESPKYVQPTHHSESLTSVFDAHGGYEQWTKMKSFSYLKEDELTSTNLQNRFIRVESPTKIIGFDGADVWVVPDTIDASRARFYSNLYFYFYAMPFVVGDVGAYYEDIASKELKGKSYQGIKISYGKEVGDAPDDNYIIWYDSETGKMEWLMYTVTYKKGTSNDDYRLIKYGEWQEFNGLMLPTSLQWFQYDGETVGEPRGEATRITNIQITSDAPDELLFIKPKNAQVAPY